MTVRMESEFVARALKLDNVASTESVTVVIADDTGLPLTEIFDKEIDENDSGSRAAKVVNLEEKLKKVIMGQDHAVALICNSIKRMVCGFNSSKRPIGSYLLLGPTGVGKTEICNQLAQHLFQAKENRCQGSKILRINMSEFKEKHTLSKLIGSPPGYIGSQEGGMLTNFVKKNSYSIVLFDEFEKAHPDIHNMLLGLLDYGGLNDGLGNFVDFTNTIIMLTSNVGQKVIIEQTMGSISRQSSTLFGNNDDTEGKHVLDNIAYSTIRAAVDITLKEMFRPELINRFDEVIIFNALSKYELTKIIELQLNKFKQTLVQEKGISLHYSNTSLRQFVDANYDPFYGAREMKRYIERHVVTQISDLIINGKLKAGDEVYMEYAREHYNGNGSSSSCGGINLMRGQFNIHYSAGLEKK
ncbi:Chaperone protein ClpB [Zancudomyces culisetae]|uniref:Chaperone protein ClpB n=1 Tax=Zancudomyces culisetae TaxID=1213189 RepID=A0A1R1PGV3_ZANCU|nr:Chaperone protein ClpB [Zancudomyces culisetae]|eukprot:OMH80206.1 Chaperone protein ClpB [Zancudomyces culisetae]